MGAVLPLDWERGAFSPPATFFAMEGKGICRVERKMPTPGPSSLARPWPGTGDLRMSCPSSRCQVHFHPPEGRTHLAVHSPQPREGDWQRLGAELGYAGCGVHTCVPALLMVWDGTTSGKRSRQAGPVSLHHRDPAQVSRSQNSKSKPGLLDHFSREHRICFI